MVYMVKHDVCTYDEYADALFIAQPVDYVYDKVIELEDDILLEVDIKKIPRALEILNASSHFNISKSELNNIVKLSMSIDITENNITINVILTVKNVAEFELTEIIKNINDIPCANESICVTLP